MWQKFFNVSKKNVFPLKPPRTRFQAWKISRKTFSHSVYHISENNTSHKQRSSDVLKKNKQTNSPTPQKCHFVSDIKNKLSEKIERTQTIYLTHEMQWEKFELKNDQTASESDPAVTECLCPPPGPCLQSIRPPLWSTTLLLLLATSLSPSSSPTLPVLPSASSPSTATQRTRTTGSSPLPGELVPWLWTLEVKK